MCEVSIYEAKTQFSKYVQLLEDGKEEAIIILKNGKPVAKIVKNDSAKGMRLGAGLVDGEPKAFTLKDPTDGMEALFGY